MLQKIKFKLVDLCIICIEKLMHKDMDGKPHVVILNTAMYQDFCEYQECLANQQNGTPVFGQLRFLFEEDADDMEQAPAPTNMRYH